MTDDEASAVYEELLQFLRQHKLDWLSQQIAHEVAEGRTEKMKLSVPEHLQHVTPFGAPRRRRRTKFGEFAKVFPYGPRDRLTTAIQAIETAIVSAAKIEKELATVLSPHQPFAVNFRSEDADGGSYGFSEGDIAFIVPAANVLMQLLEELRSEAERAD